MERKRKINSLAILYKQSSDQNVFNELYRELTKDWNRRKKIDSRNTSVDEDSILAMYEDALIKTLDLYDYQERSDEFLHLLNFHISRRRIDIGRKYTRRLKLERVLTAEEECANTLERISDNFDAVKYTSSTEENYLEKKERDKRELVSHLIESAKTLSDEVTVKILTEFSKYDSPNKLAKALGLHHETVNRKLRRVSRLYDANRFGDLRDYLAV
ncbi:hypothetical protein P4V86_15495 [Brevibacillus laterosporus]|uniref:hypothetical protein n=1 Tax=Brevibacillus laterosporus TaxID=1465 RepID=UPI00036F88E6|nr:hypothetical protein [Brevibacillus laterosporus]ATO50990.1 hypothetical protein BrL25_18955 [Brevibacillus laterosporus DSM 25]MED2004750.1 hypothetical protein [Brevibacillus laterosporus]